MNSIREYFGNKTPSEKVAMGVGAALVITSLVLLILVAVNQSAINNAERKIHALREEVLDMEFDASNFERFGQIFDEWRKLTQHIDALRAFPASTLMPCACLAAPIGVGMVVWGAQKRTPQL